MAGDSKSSWWRMLGRDLRWLMGGLLPHWKRYGKLWLGVAVLLAVVLITLVLPVEKEWLQALQKAGGKEWRPQLKMLSGWTGKWGDFTGFTGALMLLLWGLGWMLKRPQWRRVALACLLGAVLTGMLANCLRFSLGRPRPDAGLADGFYGPHFSTQYHALPSGHTASAFGAAVPVLVSVPMVGVPATLAAGVVAWARMYRNKHHPTDVTVSVFLACLIGIPLGRRALQSPADL